MRLTLTKISCTIAVYAVFVTVLVYSFLKIMTPGTSTVKSKSAPVSEPAPEVDNTYWIVRSNENPPKYRWCNYTENHNESCKSLDYDSAGEAMDAARRYFKYTERENTVIWTKEN